MGNSGGGTTVYSQNGQWLGDNGDTVPADGGISLIWDGGQISTGYSLTGGGPTWDGTPREA